ncbi:MAG: beta-ketoacyl-[acyl-carrier-protein] synthase family protein [Syntrophales bacterium]|nr:beta-ketoacyl-[acyl-carrier-protein] synthase family protein [Syntrophales bacterium]
MHRLRVFITSMGIIGPVGQGIGETIDSVQKSTAAIKPLHLFPASHIPPLPVGQITAVPWATDMPRTHTLALMASRDAMKDTCEAPDAVVIGTTTGGISLTEELLKSQIQDVRRYALHSAGSVAEYIARHVGCNGPVLTVSTACSSGNTALKIALEMLRSGKVNRVLAGGADSLCRLTYYGFDSLQLVDVKGARPFDFNRRGMSVGEGAAMFLLTAAETPPENAIAELLGGGLSCDAYHPAAPHPQGDGALCAMQKAIADAGISPDEIGYIHLHGTGTVDNDLTEARAIRSLFGDLPVPPCSSTKGAYGHTMAASGAMGTVMSIFGVTRGILPGNTGLHDPDPALPLTPISVPTQPEAPVRFALSNAFGFGGNNAVLVIGHPTRSKNTGTTVAATPPVFFSVLGSACLGGAGDIKCIIERMAQDEPFAGTVPPAEFTRYLSERHARRMKRLTRMTLSLAIAACGEKEATDSPVSVFFGTGWGGLSETHDFLEKLFESDERFTSPTDFIGSVHNASAGHVAIHFKAGGPNVTTTGGNCSFEQALMSADLLAGRDRDPLLVVGADEYHPTLSPLFDPSVAISETPSDGGGALYLGPETTPSACRIRTACLDYAGTDEQDIPNRIGHLVEQLGGVQRIRDQFGTILVGIPAFHRDIGQRQLDAFLSASGYPRRIIDYRRYTGEFASASAVAAVLAVSFVKADEVPGTHPRYPTPLGGCGVLILGFGDYITAMEVLP